MTTHYAGLGDTRSACGLPLPRVPDEEGPSVTLVMWYSIEYRVADIRHWTGELYARPISAAAHKTSIDPRHVDCEDCIRDLPEVHACPCGAPALYGAEQRGDPRFCADCAPAEVRCLGAGCNRPLFDATDAYCAGCEDPDPPSYGDPAGYGCGATL